jgi:dipeptidyl aminopeptidase/acylaminoacyl peptidase
VADLVAALPESARGALARLSPLPAVPRIRGRLLIAHGVADESIPYTESLRLAAAAGDRAHLAVFETFHHTGPQPLWRSVASRAGDGWKLLGVVDELLGR